MSESLPVDKAPHTFAVDWYDVKGDPADPNRVTDTVFDFYFDAVVDSAGHLVKGLWRSAVSRFEPGTTPAAPLKASFRLSEQVKAWQNDLPDLQTVISNLKPQNLIMNVAVGAPAQKPAPNDFTDPNGSELMKIYSVMVYQRVSAQ
jgi:hypothetical protein